MAKPCSLCKADLIPSGCGCLNPQCTNHVDKWKAAGAGYDPPKTIITIVAPTPEQKPPEPSQPPPEEPKAEEKPAEKKKKGKKKNE